jgi:hypothetical protein
MKRIKSEKNEDTITSGTLEVSTEKRGNTTMNGAQALFKALVDAGLDTCFANPGTSEMQLVYEIGTTKGVRAVLCLQENTVTGAADGYRTGEFSYVRDPYAEFLDPPEEEMMAPVRGCFRHNGCFSAVTDPGSALKPNTILEISVSQLYGDFRLPEQPTAILTMEFTFFEASNGVRGKPILQQEYSRTIPLKTATVVTLMEGWNEGLSAILADVSSDLHRSSAADR